VLRGDNEWIEVGEASNVQELCCLHTDWDFPLTIGAGCTIGHHAMLHGCTIEDHALVGMSATILNGARIGTESLVGAGSLVTEGKSFDPRHLVMGSPAKAIRPLDADAIERLHRSAEHYARNAERFASGLSSSPRA
jgi:carbonic anhydrase/acetyltransferase-like protein (isoleucine patch superfamily)